MKNSDYLIVGGGVSGTTAAEFIRMGDSEGSITIITEEPERLYSRVMLPHFLRDQVPFERLYVRKPEQYEEKNVELLTNKRANRIDTQGKKVFLSDGQEIMYKKLLVASGGKVNKLSVSGADLKGVTYLRTNQDAKEVKDLMSKGKEGVVSGCGFIGIEYAKSFIHAGLKTTCVIREPYFWNTVVGDNGGKLISKILEKSGVKIVTEAEVLEFVGEKQLVSARLNNSQEIPAQIAGIGVGIHMDLDHLRDTGLEVDKGVVTNEYLETGTTDIWAAGDIAQFYDVLFSKHHQMGNWSNAVAQGKTAGSNMVIGHGRENREKFVTVSAYTISIFDGTFTVLGDPEATDDTEIVERGSIEDGKLGRIHIRGDKIVGASLINLPADRSPISELIKNQAKLSVSKEKLGDLNFSLTNLL